MSFVSNAINSIVNSISSNPATAIGLAGLAFGLPSFGAFGAEAGAGAIAGADGLDAVSLAAGGSGVTSAASGADLLSGTTGGLGFTPAPGSDAWQQFASQNPELAAQGGNATNFAGAAPSLLSSFASDPIGGLKSLAGGIGGANGAGALSGNLSPLSGAISAYGGVNSIYQADQLRKMLPQLVQQNDPFGAQRSQYQQQLAALQANPSSITSMPGYQFQFDQGQQALARQSAGQGYGSGGAPGTAGGSGNFATASQQYGQNFAQNFYQQQLQNLMGLSGANIQPQNPGGIAIQGNQIANQTQLGGLGALAYGAQRFFPG